MATTRSVVIAADGSNPSNHALEWALENFVRESDVVVLVSAVTAFELETFSSDDPFLDPFPTASVEQALNLTAQERQSFVELHAQLESRIREKGVQEIESVVEEGDARTVIVECVEEQKKKGRKVTVVLGSRGRGVISRTLLGSVSDFVVHHCPCPCVIIRE